MKISEMEAKLKAYREESGDLDLLIEVGSTSSGGTFSPDMTDCHTAGKDEYPEDWSMPEGFKFVRLSIFT